VPNFRAACSLSTEEHPPAFLASYTLYALSAALQLELEEGGGQLKAWWHLQQILAHMEGQGDPTAPANPRATLQELTRRLGDSASEEMVRRHVALARQGSCRPPASSQLLRMVIEIVWLMRRG
jgi:hypothetical protein